MAFLDSASGYDGPISLITPAVSPLPPPVVEKSVRPPEPPPHVPTQEPTWLVVLSGVAYFHTSQEEAADFTIIILPDIEGPINTAIRMYGAETPPAAPSDWRFQLEQWVPYVAVGSTFVDPNTKSEFNVIQWRPNPFTTITDAKTGQAMNNIFTGIQVDIHCSTADQAEEVMTYRLPYNITLLARFASIKRPT